MKRFQSLTAALAAAALWTALAGQTCQAQSYRSAVLADNPLVYLSFDEQAGPSTVNAGNLGATHNATAFNNPGFGWAGAIGNDPVNRAVRLNGTSEYLNIATAIPAANFSDANYTVEGWFKKDTGSGPRDAVSLTNAAGNGFGVLLEANAAGQTLRYLHRAPVSNAGGQEINPSAQTYNVDQWHHVAIVNDSNAMRLYLDGNLDSVTNTSSAAITDALTATLGQLTHTNATRNFDGFLDEVAIYNGALSQARIQSHIAAASAQGAGDVLRTSVLNVDFTGQTPSPSVEPGFQAFSRPDATSGTQTENYASPFAATGTDIGVTVDNVAGFRNRNNMSGPDGDLGESFVFRDGSLTLTLSNLAAGEYELLTYQHDSTNTQANVDIFLTDANSNSALVASNILAGTGTSPADIGIAEIDFVSDGISDIILEFIESGTQPRPASVVVLSGFELNQISAAAVPEPASVAMWLLLGCVGVGVYLRQRRRK